MPDVRLLRKQNMLTEDSARKLTAHWIHAWNTHDLDEIMSHYGEDVVLISPVAARILSDPSGTVKGREALRAYFKKGLEAYPNLRFDLIDMMWGLSSFSAELEGVRDILRRLGVVQPEIGRRRSMFP